MTATQSPPTEHPKTASDSAERRYATVNPFTGETEKEFPYTPNVRGVRTDDWKYMHSPNGDGSPDRFKAELYNLKADPLEKNNLIDAPEAKEKLAELKLELARLQKDTGALPDSMPVNPEVRFELPEESIR